MVWVWRVGLEKREGGGGLQVDDFAFFVLHAYGWGWGWDSLRSAVNGRKS